MPIIDPRPQGSLQDLDDAGLKHNEYGSCSRPDKGNNIGCARYEDCPFRDGPKFVGVQILHNEPGYGVGERQEILPCFDYLTHRPTDEDPTDIWVVLGFEGTEIQSRGSVKQPLETGQTTHVYKDALIPRVVPKYEKISDRYLGIGRMKELREKRLEEKREKKHDDMLGITDEPQPLTPEDTDVAPTPDGKPGPRRRNG